MAPDKQRPRRTVIRVPFRELSDFHHSTAVSFPSYITRKLRAAGIPANEGTLKIELDFVDDCIVWRAP